MKPIEGTNLTSRTLDLAWHEKARRGASYRVMASPNAGHFEGMGRRSDLHCVIEFGADDEAICSFVQRGARVKFYRGMPDWSEWLPAENSH